MDPRDGITPSRCPMCKEILDAAEAVEGRSRPEPGDISFCVECGTILVFTDEMTVRLANDRELEELAKNDPEMHRQTRKWAQRAAARSRSEQT